MISLTTYLSLKKKEIYISVNAQESGRKYLNVCNKPEPHTANCNHQKDEGRGGRDQILLRTNYTRVLVMWKLQN